MPNTRTRTDNVLNTGLSSAVDRRLYSKQKELFEKKKSEKEQMQAKLGSMSQRGQVILDWISEEKRLTGDMTNVILNVDNEENVRAQFLARKMHLAFLNKAESRVKKYLKEDES